MPLKYAVEFCSFGVSAENCYHGSALLALLAVAVAVVSM